jgi:hypothetical protein
MKLTPFRRVVGWGWNRADSLRSLDRLGTLSNVEGLKGSHAQGVTASQKDSKRIAARF